MIFRKNRGRNKALYKGEKLKKKMSASRFKRGASALQAPTKKVAIFF